MSEEITVDRLVAVYLKMRAKKKEIVRAHDLEIEKIDEGMAAIEANLLGRLNDNKVKSMATTLGTFYKEEEFKPSCADWGVFYNWIKTNDAFNFLERRVTKTAIKAHMAETGELPPGINVLREWVVRVRVGKDS